MTKVLLATLIGIGAVFIDAIPAHSATNGRCVQYESLLARNGLPVASFSRTMYRESRCNSRAINRHSGARGLLQIMPQHAGRWNTCAGLNLMSANGNIQCAARLYRRAGMRPWRG